MTENVGRCLRGRKDRGANSESRYRLRGFESHPAREQRPCRSGRKGDVARGRGAVPRLIAPARGFESHRSLLCTPFIAVQPRGEQT